jgi:hypothetical protein
MEHSWNNTNGGKLEVFRVKAVPVPFYTSQISHTLAWD